MNKTFIIAEIGINHNGSVDLAKELIDHAVSAGCNAVKFQKRTLDLVYSPEELDRPRKSPWGTTNREQKEGLEFGQKEFDIIDEYCQKSQIEWFASAWDIPSQEFLQQYDSKYNKVASAMLTVEPLLHAIAKEGKYTFISTGMSTLEEIDKAVEIFRRAECPFELMHCNSSYPLKDEDADLRVINTLRDRYSCKVGYSGHETGLCVSYAAVALGCTSLERHISLDRSMYGSDQSASLEVSGLTRLVKDIRGIESSMGDGIKKITKQESEIRQKLANPHWVSSFLCRD
jgi:N-acetylneuraminate synthase